MPKLNTTTSPLSPTIELTQSYMRKWGTLEKYKFQEDSLSLLFQEFCPNNSDIVHVLLKVSALNDFYTTNIYDTHSVAKHIIASDVDSRIADGDCSLVNQMASVVVGGKIRNFYSFASKYCNHHNPEAFPIYDSYVEKMLLHFRDAHNFAQFSKAELKQYSRFVAIIHSFRQHYSLEQFSLRQIAIYLWLAGKDSFGRFLQKQTKEIKDRP
ncbi:MAG: hypothetical protein SGI77_23570 [Pirellulaceae bacterium]|nr:hypothetical protein [Pirellulaceae bacterium]